ncbi:MAG: hypothetical protein IT342_20925 [Candidatus Melainabacteria bacterium]|nr:hypothetical protein [Candidatus Melainabacteria bacterium]
MDKLASDEKKRDAWQEHALAHMLRFRALSLRSKMEAVEGMANLLRRFEQMRKSGAFKTYQAEYSKKRNDEECQNPPHST